MNKIISKLKNQEGFTLIEVLIGMGIFGIAILSIIQIFYYSIMLNARSSQLVSSANIAREVMDGMRLMTLEELDALPLARTENVDINSDGNVDFIYDWNIIREDLALGSGYVRYTVTITVNPRGRSGFAGKQNAYSLRSVLLRNPHTQE